MKQNTERRVVITGLGVVAPNGIGKEAFWEATSKGVSGIKTIERSSMENLPIQVAGEINNFLANDYIERKLVNRTDRMTHFVFAATQEVLRDSNITLADVNPERVGVVISNTMGGIDFVMEQIRAVYTRGPRALSAYTAIAWLQVANVGQLAIRYGLQGYCKTPVNDAAGGLDAMTLAYRTIKRGSADVIIAGGCEAFIHPFILFVFAHDRDYYI
ncbi:MAG TPA: beta-ketoacyl synthase N-terminal-like domain-containing protein, partial [Ktedonobacteraceae bacterium]|nr:beta-ketoacyl synthase N-terminal-like domain-containing protein [Ktedonobacteraceae bacterium]